jgi:hypothetical protein
MQGYAAFIAMTDPTLGKQMLAEIASLNAT